MDYVVTEFGIAELRGKSLSERADLGSALLQMSMSIQEESETTSIEEATDATNNDGEESKDKLTIKRSKLPMCHFDERHGNPPKTADEAAKFWDYRDDGLVGGATIKLGQ